MGMACAMLGIAPVAAAPPAPAAYYWTGFYAGIGAGYGWNGARSVGFTGSDDLTRSMFAGSTFGDPAETAAGPATLHLNGFMGGVYAGYNWQWAPRWLVGIEADLNAAGIDDTGAMSFVLFGSQVATIDARQRLPWLATLRGRLGYLMTDRMLLFGSLGLALGEVKQQATFATSLPASISSSGGGAFICAGAAAVCFNGSDTRIAAGVALGAGAEFALTPALHAKVEYLYANLAGGNSLTVIALDGGGATPASFDANFPRLEISTVRFGLSYRF